MAHYQTFPDISGSSQSFEKLKTLKLPPLKDVSFLDVGCNEGFFCGFAKFQGAKRVVGIDHNKSFIDQAKNRFPGIDFVCQAWDQPVSGPFDVILLASALHYANDQKKLIDSLIEYLSPRGTLVLEIGLSYESGNKWVSVTRSIDERTFPTHAKLASILEPYAWKIMGPSVDQVGDPLSRVVVHINKRMPYAYLLMLPSGFGKTTVSRQLSTAKDMCYVSGDVLLREISQDKQTCDSKLKALVKKNYASEKIAPLVENIFQQNLGAQWVDLWLSRARNGNVLIDSYVPEQFWGFITRHISDKGFVPIQLTWNLIGSKLHKTHEYAEMAAAYLEHLESLYGCHDNTYLSSKTNIFKKLFKTKQSTCGANVVDFSEIRPSDLPLDFDADEYLCLHPDVAHAGVNPALHYLKHGKREGRQYKRDHLPKIKMQSGTDLE